MLLDRLNELWQTLVVPAWAWLTHLEWTIIFAAALLNFVIWLVRKPLADFLITLAKWIGGAIGVEVNDTVKAGIRPAVRALVVVVGVFAALKLIEPPQSVSELAERVLHSILVTAVFASIYAFCDPMAKKLDAYRTEQSSIQLDWFVRGSRILVVFIGVAAVLGIWGIDLGPILTGMGVVGAALALAAQDILKNFLAGITSMGEKRFRIGEWVRVEGVVEGTIESVDFRSTLIRRFDLAPVYVPNAQLADVPLTNFSRMSHRRIYWTVGIVHSAKTSQLEKIKGDIESYLETCGDFTDPETARRIVRIDSITDSSIDVMIYCFTKSSDYVSYQDAKERLVVAIRTIVADAGTQFAYPSSSIYLETVPPGAAGIPDLEGSKP